jgi:hypothetical protein
MCDATSKNRETREERVVVVVVVHTQVSVVLKERNEERNEHKSVSVDRLCDIFYIFCARLKSPRSLCPTNSSHTDRRSTQTDTKRATNRPSATTTLQKHFQRAQKKTIYHHLTRWSTTTIATTTIATTTTRLNNRRR